MAKTQLKFKLVCFKMWLYGRGSHFSWSAYSPQILANATNWRMKKKKKQASYESIQKFPSFQFILVLSHTYHCPSNVQLYIFGCLCHPHKMVRGDMFVMLTGIKEDATYALQAPDGECTTIMLLPHISLLWDTLMQRVSQNLGWNPKAIFARTYSKLAWEICMQIYWLCWQGLLSICKVKSAE